METDAQDLKLRMQEEFLGHGRFSLLGRTDMANVGRLLTDGRDQFIKLDEITIDLEQVDCCNTAGLALLLEWSSWCGSHGIKLKYDKPREELLKIVRINDVEEVLTFAQ